MEQYVRSNVYNTIYNKKFDFNSLSEEEKRSIKKQAEKIRTMSLW